MVLPVIATQSAESPRSLQTARRDCSFPLASPALWPRLSRLSSTTTSEEPPSRKLEPATVRERFTLDAQADAYIAWYEELRSTRTFTRVTSG